MGGRVKVPSRGGNPGAISIDADHRYWVDGVNVPGFTEIATDLGIIKPNPFYTEEGREDGKAIHRWLIFLASGRETAKKPHPRIAGRVEAIKRFLRETEFRFHGGEKPLFHANGRWACTPDLWGTLAGIRVVIDGKRGGALPWHPLQTACQKMALSANGWTPRDRYSLYLRDGAYTLDNHDDPQDEYRWQAIVAAYHAKKHYGG